ncbi:GntR family transcriptional regulator [Paenalkalicoccus suaedae]|uniref:GntR family transcriptional regulator n=1 Tax=Paenalkalicoccus suaedae TaxID=2592382 RepID=A0A859FCY8_9BACI|nr:GntR family transcriptional regulator [Paenalkalicoccus suaedae]QKS70708.1 GntR family transcriptional regulator [Paenalkalicoccus suaedae]
MFFQIDPRSNTPLYEQIIQQVKEMCMKGVLKPDEKLPSVRELSAQMVINPNTVSKAYQELERQGIIHTLRGRGTFISQDVPTYSDPRRIQEMKQSLKQMIVDARYAGLSKQEILTWLEEFYEEMEGNSDEGPASLKDHS